MGTIPAALQTIVALADGVRRGAAPAAELILLTDGGELRPDNIEPVLLAFDRIRGMESHVGDRRRARESIGAILRGLPIRPAVVDDIVAELGQLDQQFEALERTPDPARADVRRALERRAGLAARAFRIRFGRVREKDQAVTEAKRQPPRGGCVSRSAGASRITAGPSGCPCT